MTNPDFIKLSESMGAKAIKCSNLEELPAKMKEFLEYDNSRPILMECLVSSEHVYPMVAAGKALHEQIVSPLMPFPVGIRADISFTHLCEKRPSRSVNSCSLVLRCIYDICLQLSCDRMTVYIPFSSCSQASRIRVIARSSYWPPGNACHTS